MVYCVLNTSMTSILYIFLLYDYILERVRLFLFCALCSLGTIFYTSHYVKQNQTKGREPTTLTNGTLITIVRVGIM